MDDDWTKAAISDADLVAELLLTMHHSPPSPPPPPPPKPAILPLQWSVRQPRTRAATHKRGVARGSPTTPLSWTGGSTSFSGGAAALLAAVDGSEESSRLGSGSKLTAANELTIKRSRKKKTTNELKEEEILMQQDNKQLKRTLAGVLGNLAKKQSENTELKRMKMALAYQKPYTNAALTGPSSLPNSCPVVVTGVGDGSERFVLPDLNVEFVEANEGGPRDE